ncbi:Gfo/Idh/MocA family oxidoreductase [Paenibacillus sp. MWE-103]|uniref:Gfo/Idh/MocA family oxidoreductase n=1 Tax=Paenibacillus artemisiicola TaxID=1172618 RepID=A0ABS3WHE0_9BACL|nr:Gfo/Idh/MocA family oxidoreductase [Paenibacillus artemisiicola]MBO7747658.1 Gfo/Idh/MocA family oxidoreductase [Paenibacillus artemisiicola]
MSKRMIRFGVIGCGLMGKEFASAAARWLHLEGVGFEPRIVAVCDANPAATEWFTRQVPSVERAYGDYKELLADDAVEAVYCAVPHHLHAQLYVDIIEAGKHLLGEKPFGIDAAANARIGAALAAHPGVVVRCSSEFPFYPGAQQVVQWVNEGRFGRIIEVEAGFWHASDLDPAKPINWKRRIATNGEYGCMGDLGMHVLHLPLRFGWRPANVRALLSKIVPERPDGKGGTVPCETWDNAILACDVRTEDQRFPMVLSTKRIAPGHANTWFIRIQGTELSAEFSTKHPKQVASLPYSPGRPQAWHIVDAPYKSAYGTITGGIFEFGFSDSILQMWAAFCDELAHGADGMSQPFRCATPEEALGSHRVFTAALASERDGSTVAIDWGN